jgi:L-lactate dehydrogenase complex protein LldE
MTLRGLRVPQDIAIVGYDDIEFAGAAAVPLSSVRQPREQLGRTAADLLIEEAAGAGEHQHRHVVFKPDLWSAPRASAHEGGPVHHVSGRRALPGGRQGHRAPARAAGHEVVFPERRPAAARCTSTRVPARGHSARAQSRQTFSGYDAIVAPSVPAWDRCGTSTWRGEPGRPQWTRRARSRGASHTYELSEFLVDVLGVTDVGAYYPHRVTYHPTCHSLRMLRVGEKPLQLLREVRGIDLVELPDADQCCGFGGTFALKNADVSTAMLADKMRHVMGTKAEVLTAGDSSCLMHIGGGLSRLRSGARTVHLAEILAGEESA